MSLEYYRHEVALFLNVKNPRLAWKRNIKNLASKYGLASIAELLNASYIGIAHLTEEDVIKFRRSFL